MTPFALYAIRYAHRESTRGEHFYRGDACADAPYPIDYFVWAAVSADATVVIDAGFTPATAARRAGREYLQTPMSTLARLGVDAGTVEHLVITHLHYDHVGHFADFPAARLYVQRSEYEFWTGPFANRGDYPHLYEHDDMAGLARELDTGRLQLLDGDATVVPGVTVHRVGGHTAGLQIVRVATAAGRAVLASDASHFYENIDDDRPYSIVDHLPSMYAAFDRVRELAGGPSLVVPGHDPLVLARYPAAAPGLEGLAVRIA